MKKPINNNTIFQGFLMFCVLFDVSFIQLPSIISTRKIAFFILLIVIAIKKHTISFGKHRTRKLKSIFVTTILILAYIILISILNGVINHQFSIIPRLIYFILYSLIGCIILLNYFDSEIVFMKASVLGLVFQSVATIIIFFVPKVSEFTNSFIRAAGNVSFLRTDRATGLGAEAGYLTLLLFMGVVFSNYIIKYSKYRLFFYFTQILFIATMFIVGRTGLYFSLAFIVYIVILSAVREKKITKSLKIIVLVLISGTIILTIIRYSLSTQQYFRLYNRLIGIFNGLGNDGSIQHLTANNVPGLSIETIFGTGIFRGETSSGLEIWHDSGYVQMYVALGLIAAIVFYMVLFFTYIRLLKLAELKNNKDLFWYMLFVMITYVIVEIKEPFTLKYTLPLCFFTTVFLFIKRYSYETFN